MTDNVMIQMKSIQSIYDEKTETELITQGKFSKKNNVKTDNEMNSGG